MIRLLIILFFLPTFLFAQINNKAKKKYNQGISFLIEAAKYVSDNRENNQINANNSFREAKILFTKSIKKDENIESYLFRAACILNLNILHADGLSLYTNSKYFYKDYPSSTENPLKFRTYNRFSLKDDRSHKYSAALTYKDVCRVYNKAGNKYSPNFRDLNTLYAKNKISIDILNMALNDLNIVIDGNKECIYPYSYNTDSKISKTMRTDYLSIATELKNIILNNIVLLRNSNLNGLVINYYDSEYILSNSKNYLYKASINYLDGIPNGEYKIFYKNGKLFFNTQMKDGYGTGEYKMYYENGNLRETGYYVDNQKITKKNKDELLMNNTLLFSIGTKSTKTYYENGNVHTGILVLKDGSTEHYKNGNLLQVNRDSVLNGVDIGKIRFRYYENGNQRSYDFYIKNIKKGIVYKKLWYDNGQLKLEENYKDGNKDGFCQEWYDNGQLKLEENYKDGNKDGVCQEWNENGQLEYESIWDENDEVSFKEWDEYGILVADQSFLIGKVDIRDVNEYNIEDFVDVFLKDCKSNGIRVSKQNIKCKFKFLPSPIIALSYSMNHNSKITIEVDAERWEEASIETKWYIIYHELGHDVLNLEHGHGGKMMFPIAEDYYDWDEFFEDKLSMFNYYKTKK